MVQRRYTNVPDCTLNARIGKLGQCLLRNQGVRAKFEGFDVFVTKERHECDTGIRSDLVHLDREMDGEDFVSEKGLIRGSCARDWEALRSAC